MPGRLGQDDRRPLLRDQHVCSRPTVAANNR
jgi:hypothetical protein